MEKNIVIGVDLGGTRIKLGAVNQQGERIHDEKINVYDLDMMYF